jgi:CSLREA domain-containing protein
VSTRDLIRALAIGATLAGLVAAPATAGAATVTKPADTNDGVCGADCSLREAIEDAAPGETVNVPASAVPYEVKDGIGFSTLVIEKDLTIAGAGAGQTEVRANGPTARVFTVRSTPAVAPSATIRDLKISGGGGNGGGFASQGGGVIVGLPGGALAAPKLLLERVWVTGNTASTSSGQAVGGGASATGAGTELIVRDSLISGNKALATMDHQATGGGIATFTSSIARIENTTIVGNEAIADGAGSISARAGGVFLIKASRIVNSTIAGNKALKTAPGATEGRAGNIEVLGTEARLRNTIVSGGISEKADTGDCFELLPALSEGGNVLPATCGPAAGDRAAADALLGPLADNGGPTQTMALLAGSPAIDAGTACPPPSADQRGLPRPSGAGCDSGAYEVQVPGPAPAGPPPPPGEPKPICAGKPATIVGTAGRDVLKGTRKADVIVALAGNDAIRALAGNDLICGGKGKDVISGGPGRDRLLGQKGADTLRGGPGKDRLLGGAGADRQRQ